MSKVKQTFGTANCPKDPMHTTTLESLIESEHAVQVVYNQSTMTAHDSNPPKEVDWELVVLGRTVNRKTGVRIPIWLFHSRSAQYIFNDPMLIPRSTANRGRCAHHDIRCPYLFGCL